MKKIKVLNIELSIAQLIGVIMAVLLVISAIVVSIVIASQTKHRKDNSAALNKEIDSCIELCDRIYAEMNRSNDETYLAYKENIQGAKNDIERYTATNALMNYTFSVFVSKYKSEKDKDFANNQDPNDYNINEYRKKLGSLQDELIAKQNALKIARDNYSVVTTIK